MKRKLAAILLISTIVLSGCSGKGLTGSSASKDNSAKVQSSEAAGSNANAAADQRVQVNTNFGQVNPGTVPQLSGTQKAQVNTKLNSTLKDLDNTLKSIQDAQDVDVSSVN